MKTLNDFFARENEVYVLSNNELITVKGGDNPPDAPGDPFEIPPSGGIAKGRSALIMSLLGKAR